MNINWTAVSKAINYYNRNIALRQQLTYQEWILTEYGIDHDTYHIHIVNKELYSLFLLRWS
jgi:hypothetical protein